MWLKQKHRIYSKSCSSIESAVRHVSLFRYAKIKTNDLVITDFNLVRHSYICYHSKFLQAAFAIIVIIILVQTGFPWRDGVGNVSTQKNVIKLYLSLLSPTVSYSGGLARKVPYQRCDKRITGFQHVCKGKTAWQIKACIGSCFMLHFLACDDKSCTRLKDLLDRIFLEGKAPHEIILFKWWYNDDKNNFFQELYVKSAQIIPFARPKLLNPYSVPGQKAQKTRCTIPICLNSGEQRFILGSLFH